MNDVSGSRFLRMAGSDGFQRELNRSSQPIGADQPAGDFSKMSVPGSAAGNVGSINSGSNDYSMFITSDTNNSSSLMGPGAFDRQVQREKDLRDTYPDRSDDIGMVNDFASLNNQMQSGGASDGSNIAMKYIRNAAMTNPVNIQALDKSIRQRPLYHEAKSKLEGLKTFGDVARWSREQLPNYAMPDPMEAVESPDFDRMYDRTKDDLDDLKI